MASTIVKKPIPPKNILEERSSFGFIGIATPV